MGATASPRRGHRGAGIAALSLALLATPLRAEQALPSPETRAAAQQLFERGLVLLDAGDKERALDHFLRSRALVPGKGNTANAAHCLHELGRYDEALELYEVLATRFAADLSAENTLRLVPAMRSLRERVGAVVVTANVEGSVLIDGRPRGRLPLDGPVRVLGGLRVVRVLKDGYATFEGAIEVRVGETAHLDAVLRPLAQAGQLRLEDPTNDGAEVFVDRVQVGVIPWEGTLGPGEHLVWAETAERGSAPARAIVIQGQTATLRLRSAPVGPVATIVVEPATAESRLDGVALGAGSWSGRLPVGDHEVVASEPGYFSRTVRLTEAEPGGASAQANLRLDVDAAHPRWPRRPVGEVTVDLLGGVALGRALGSDAETWCAGSSGRGVLGGLAGARVGFRFLLGLSVEIVGGYFTVGTSFTRSRSTSFTSDGASVPLTYTLEDHLRVGGPFVGGGLGYRAPIGGRFAIVSHAMVGALLAGVSDPITGSATTAQDHTAIFLTGREQRSGATPILVEPELDLEARFGGLHLGAGLGVAFVVGGGPELEHDLVEVVSTGCSHDPASSRCAPASRIVESERGFRPFAVVVPTASLGYTF